MTITLVRPAPGKVTSGFGPRLPGKLGSANHLGIDFSWNLGWTISAAAAGTVIFTGPSGGYGNLTRIDHGNHIETRYGHQSKINVTVGQKVAAGQAIGVIGNTGNSNGAHLHFELLINGVRVNPAPYFAGTAGGGIVIINPTGDNKMYLAWDTNGTGYLVTEQGWAGLPSMQVYNLFNRLINSNQSSGRPETFNKQEVDIMNNQIRLLALANNTQTMLDPIKLASAISDALPGELSITATLPPEVEQTLDKLNAVEWEALVAEHSIDPEQLAAAFDAAVPRVAAAIVKQAGQVMAGSAAL